MKPVNRFEINVFFTLY